MHFRAIIIEDEENNIIFLKELLKRFANDFECVGVAGKVMDAVNLIKSTAPDLIFLDVRLADGTGFDVLKQLSGIDFQIIFITAYDNYTFDAIKFSAVDYLLKPVGFMEFEEACGRARIRILEKQQLKHIEILLHNLAQRNDLDRRLAVATMDGYEFVDVRNIMWCSSEGGYTIFHLSDKQHVTSSRNLGFYETLLSPDKFCRIHNGFIVNLLFVSRYIKGKGGCVEMEDGTMIEVSQRRKADFISRLSGL